MYGASLKHYICLYDEAHEIVFFFYIKTSWLNQLFFLVELI